MLAEATARAIDQRATGSGVRYVLAAKSLSGSRWSLDFERGYVM